MGPVATKILEGGDGQLLPGGGACQDSPRLRLLCTELGPRAGRALP